MSTESESSDTENNSETDTMSQDEIAARVGDIGERLDLQQGETMAAFQQFRDELAGIAESLQQLYRAQEELAAQAEAQAEAQAVADAKATEEAALAIATPVAPVAIPIETQTEPVVEAMAPVVQQPVPTQAPAVVLGDSQLEPIIFGESLAAIPSLAGDRGQVLAGMMSGDEDAMTLAGNLLIFRAANSEQMPQLIKGLGEAYYQWRPSSGIDDDFRAAIIQYVHQTCEANGVTHRIELVQSGDRFESKRHTSKQRGVEVVDVHGWVVVRENGSPYTKATVTVQ